MNEKQIKFVRNWLTFGAGVTPPQEMIDEFKDWKVAEFMDWYGDHIFNLFEKEGISKKKALLQLNSMYDILMRAE